MAYKYRWLTQALDDMSKEIGYVYTVFGIKAAQRAASRIHERIRQLCQFPYSGMRYEDLLYKGTQVRILHVKQVSIIYCVQDNLITIIAIWNNFQNLDRLRDTIEAR